MLYPLKFCPIFKERVWGGRKLQELYNKPLPPNLPIGESWEVSDRPGDISSIADGPLAGRDLRWLLETHGKDVMGDAPTQNGLFPLLVKILDAREKLSLQVHPPKEVATTLGGEPKTEMWFIADAEPGAQLYAGLRRGVTPAEFETKMQSGTVAGCFHQIQVRQGDALFLPSGRVHAIGAGLVIFEIQQNSDTTFRVYDWDRLGLDGKPRALHVREALQSIDFRDFEPTLVTPERRDNSSSEVRVLVKNALFSVEQWRPRNEAPIPLPQGVLQILGILKGCARLTTREGSVTLRAGDFCLVPASLSAASLVFAAPGTFLRTHLGQD